MKKIAKYTFFTLFISTLLYACNDFIEKDIDNETVNLLSPGNNLKTPQVQRTFWWDWLEGAEFYNMQVVQGTFSSPINFVIDTLVSSNKFDLTLYPGSFQWRVRGENNGGVTNFTTYTLNIDSTLDISSTTIKLISPILNYISKEDSIEFKWELISSADVYDIQIHQNSWGNLYSSKLDIKDDFHWDKLPEGKYVWAVRGTNDITKTSTIFANPPRTLVIDTTAPNLVTLNSPTPNQELPDTINTYTWTQGTNPGGGEPTELTDVLYIYSDSGNTELGGYPRDMPSGVLTHKDSIGFDHYWMVQTKDAAGNVGPKSEIRRVNIK